ncbi:MAG: hypothetical protein QM752_00280 [Gammaproteobacteria bacterium]
MQLVKKLFWFLTIIFVPVFISIYWKERFTTLISLLAVTLAYMLFSDAPMIIKFKKSCIIIIKKSSLLNFVRIKFPTIVIGKGDNYEKIKIHREKIYRTLSIGVRNNSNDFLTNCKLYLDHTKKDGKIGTLLINNTFDIPPKKERYISIASYGEAIDNNENGNEYITFSIPNPGFFAYEHMPSADKKHIITLRLISSENVTVEANCYLWVNENRKLHLEKI